jgi:hypothetical protein
MRNMWIAQIDTWSIGLGIRVAQMGTEIGRGVGINRDFILVIFRRVWYVLVTDIQKGNPSTRILREDGDGSSIEPA